MIRGTLLALRFMGKDRGGRGGVVVNMGSNVSLRPYVSLPIYTATKHAILGFTRSYGVSMFLFTDFIADFLKVSKTKLLF